MGRSCRGRAATPLALRRAGAVGLGVAVTVVLTVAMAVMACALPAADDFLRATRTGYGDAGRVWWRYVFQFVYLRWQGRWTSCGLEAALLPRLDLTRGYPLLLFAVTALDAAGVYVACRWITRGGPRRLGAGMTAAGVALLWAGLPSVAEAVNWFVGAVENTLPLAAAAALLAATASMPTTARRRRAAAAALAAGAVVVAGFHELYAAMLCVALTVGAVATHRARTPDRRARWAVAMAAALGLAVVVVAPGNANRLGHPASSHSQELGYDLRLAGGLLWRHARVWALDPKLMAASLWVACSPGLEAARRPWSTAGRVAWRWVVPAAGASMVALGFALPYYAFGNGVPRRTLSADYVVFVAAWLLTVYCWTRPLGSAPTAAGDAWRRARRPAVATVALLAMAVSLVATGNVPLAVRDLAGPVAPWHAASESRYARLRASGVDSSVVVPRLPAAPRLLVGGELADDPQDWLNTGPATYFHVARLGVERPQAPANAPRPDRFGSAPKQVRDVNGRLDAGV